jgi:hypothetical protein
MHRPVQDAIPLLWTPSENPTHLCPIPSHPIMYTHLSKKHTDLLSLMPDSCLVSCESGPLPSSTSIAHRGYHRHHITGIPREEPAGKSHASISARCCNQVTT